MTRCSVKNIWVLALGTSLDPRFKTLTFGNQTNAQDAVTRVTAECAGYMRSEYVTPSMSQVKAFPLFYKYIIQRTMYCTVYIYNSFTVHNGGSTWPKKRGWLWQPVGTSGRPIWLVALVCIKHSSRQKHIQWVSPSSVLICCRFNSRSSKCNGWSNSEGSALFGLPRPTRPITYWYWREAVYPHLHKLAKRYLHVAATSVPCERDFSKAGGVVTKKRNRIKSNSAEITPPTSPSRLHQHFVQQLS